MPNSRWQGRRTPAAAMILVLGLLTAACGSSSGSDEREPGRLRVLTTFTVTADMARQVAGDRVDVDSITKPGSEIHEYQPTPDDLVRGQDADLVLDNGLGLERWFEQFIDRTEIPSATLSDGVAPVPIAVGPYGGQPNPHAWMSPRAGVVYVENIRAALTRLDPAGAETFRANAARYSEELRRVNDELVAALAVLPPSRRALVTCEGAFSYLARDAGLREGYLWPVNTESEGTPQQIAATVRLVRDDAVPAVFCESTVRDDAQRQVAAETGAVLGPPLFVDSLSAPGGPVPSYLELLRYDARAIAGALTERAP